MNSTHWLNMLIDKKRPKERAARKVLRQPRKKRCIECKRNLPLHEFYKNPKMKGGCVNRCKKCATEYQIEYNAIEVSNV